MGKKIRTLVIDDEALARSKIKELIFNDDEIELIGEASDGNEAIIKINELNPDLIFLDIQLPQPDGFGILRQIPRTSMPYIIFITAYDEYAVKAFEINALDYLLKPFTSMRFLLSLDRAKKAIREGLKSEVVDAINTVINDFGSSVLDKIPLKKDGKIFLIKVDDIIFIEAKGNNLLVHTNNTHYKTRETLRSMINNLSEVKFYRIHRSIIINIDKIQHLEHWGKGEYLITLVGNKNFTSSKLYRGNIEKLIKIK